MTLPPDAGRNLPLLRGVSRSFYLSIRLLPPGLRRPVGLAYLLARACDTVADTATLAADLRLQMLRTLADAIAGDVAASARLPDLSRDFAPRQSDAAERRLILALADCLEALERTSAADRQDIRAVLHHITRGQSLDVQRFGASGPVRALANARELEEYTYLVAGCVGEFWTDLATRHLPRFAAEPAPALRELGRQYGMGLQLVNILRDQQADLALGRCYLPADELAAAGAQPGALAQASGPLAAVRGKWLAVAEAQLAQGVRYADAVNHRRMRAASALPALIGLRTLALLQAAPGAIAPVKVRRAEVRAMLWRLGLTLAARGPLAAQFARLRAAQVPRMGEFRP